jgi:hypothetical protein
MYTVLTAKAAQSKGSNYSLIRQVNGSIFHA